MRRRGDRGGRIRWVLLALGVALVTVLLAFGTGSVTCAEYVNGPGVCTSGPLPEPAGPWVVVAIGTAVCVWALLRAVRR